MKQTLKEISKWLLAIATVSMVAVSCDQSEIIEPDPDPNDPTDTTTTDYGIVITDVVPSFSSVSFTVTAEDAKALAYTCVAKGETLTAKEVFEVGDASGTSSGTFVLSKLESDTEYTLLVSKNGSNGYEGPTSYDFKTEVNSGLPATPQSAGIRVDDVEEVDMTWTVTNGDEIDFSYIMVQPTILMENLFLEAPGVSEEDYVMDFILTYGYLCLTLEGAGASATYTFATSYGTSLIFPDTRFTIYTLGCTGNSTEENGATGLAVTSADLRTLPMTRTGDPQVSIECVEQGYIMLRHSIVPNDDCKYWSAFFTKTEEIDEFRQYYDDLEGEGQGDVRLTEYVKMADDYVLEQTYSMEVRVGVGWDQEGIDFSRLALAFDANLVTADKYAECISQVLENSDSPAGVYDMKVDSVGAGNFYLYTSFGENTAHVYWKLVDAGSIDEYLKDSTYCVELARELWNEGWAEWRDDGTTGEGDLYEARHFVWGESSNHNYQIVSSSLNYDGVLSTPVLTEPFTTLSRSFSDDEPAVAIQQADVAKTNILLNYIVEEGTRECDERLLYQRIMQDNDPEYSEILAMDDEALREWFMTFTTSEYGGEYADEANVWATIRTDTDVSNPYSYYFNWSGMEPGEEYTVFWTTENSKGEISKLKRLALKTATNDGGDNPAFDAIIIDNITKDEQYDGSGDLLPYSTFTARATFQPNLDICQYYCVFVDSDALTSYYYDVNDPESLNDGLYTMVMREGTPAIEDLWIENSFGINTTVWAVAIGTGANGISSKLTYQAFNCDGTIGDMVEIDMSEDASSVLASYSTINKNSYTRFTETIPYYKQSGTPNFVTTAPRVAAERSSAAVTYSKDEANSREGDAEVEILTLQERTLRAVTKRIAQ